MQCAVDRSKSANRGKKLHFLTTNSKVKYLLFSGIADPIDGIDVGNIRRQIEIYLAKFDEVSSAVGANFTGA